MVSLSLYTSLLSSLLLLLEIILLALLIIVHMTDVKVLLARISQIYTEKVILKSYWKHEMLNIWTRIWCEGENIETPLCCCNSGVNKLTLPVSYKYTAVHAATTGWRTWAIQRKDVRLGCWVKFYFNFPNINTHHIHLNTNKILTATTINPQNKKIFTKVSKQTNSTSLSSYDGVHKTKWHKSSHAVN